MDIFLDTNEEYLQKEVSALAENFLGNIQTQSGLEEIMNPERCIWSHMVLSSQYSIENETLLCNSTSHQAITGTQFFYTIITPFIILIGIIGNVLCIRIFTQPRLIRQSNSTLFIAMSASDLLVLLFYVTPDWFERGLAVFVRDDRFKWFTVDGICQTCLYFSYVSRFVSVWILVISTAERYFTVYRPFLRRRLFRRSSITTTLIWLVIISFLVCLWKPISSGVIAINYKSFICASKSEYRTVAFVGDVVYAALISVVPSALILVFNTVIAKRLLLLRKHRHLMRRVQKDSSRISSQTSYYELQPMSSSASFKYKLPVEVSPSFTSDSHFLTAPSTPKGVVSCNGLGYQVDIVGMQFAGLLILISSFYLILSWPYYIMWIIKWYEGFPVPGFLGNSTNGGGSTHHFDAFLAINEQFKNNIKQASLTSDGLPSVSTDSLTHQTGQFQNLFKNEFGTTQHSVNIKTLMVDTIIPITRAIFYANFSVNFFLYSFASKFFRKEMKRMFTVRTRRQRMRALYDSYELPVIGETQRSRPDAMEL